MDSQERFTSEQVRESTDKRTLLKALGDDYSSFPRQFVSYKWFKPILVGLLTFVFEIIFMFVPFIAAVAWAIALQGGTDNIEGMIAQLTDTTSPLFFQGPGLLAVLGSVCVMLPALALSVRIVYDRPFSSYSSTRGGFNWKIFGCYVVVLAIVMTIFMVIATIADPSSIGDADGVNKFTIAGYVLILLVFAQGAAEEYVYRGLIMQTIGAWTRIPIIAIVISALLFAFSHTYGVWGIVSVFIMGCAYGFVAWYTRGLEATCAAHGINNLLSLSLVGLGIAGSSETAPVPAFIQTIIMTILLIIVVITITKITGWDKSDKDNGVATFNAKKQAKFTQQQQQQQQQQPM